MRVATRAVILFSGGLDSAVLLYHLLAEFAEAMARAISLCDWHAVTLVRPFVGMTKAEIVRKGAELGVPFELT